MKEVCVKFAGFSNGCLQGKYESTWAACQPTLHGRHSLHEVTKFDHNYFHNKKSLKKF